MDDADPATSRTLRIAATGGSARDGRRGTSDEPAAGDGGAGCQDAASRAEPSQPRRTVGRPRSAPATRGRLPTHPGRPLRLAPRAHLAVRRTLMMGAAPPSSSLPDDWTKPLSQPRLFGPRRTRACGQHRTSRAPDCVDKLAAAPDQYGSAAYRRSAARRPARAAIPGRPSRTERRGPRQRCDDGPDRRRPCPRRLWRTISRFWTEAAARTKMRTQQFYSPVDEQRRPIPRVHPVERGLAASGRTGPVQHSARRCRLALRELEDGHGSSRMGGYRPNDLSDSDGSLPSGTLIGPDGPGGLLRRLGGLSLSAHCTLDASSAPSRSHNVSHRNGHSATRAGRRVGDSLRGGQDAGWRLLTHTERLRLARTRPPPGHRAFALDNGIALPQSTRNAADALIARFSEFRCRHVTKAVEAGLANAQLASFHE